MIWIAGACFVCLCVCLPLYLHFRYKDHLHLASCYKSAGTLCAVMFALVASIRLNPSCYVCAAGLLIHAVADYVLEFNFMAGAGLFLAGHICFIAFFLRLVPVALPHGIILLLLLGFMAFIYYHWRKQIGKQLKPLIVYGVGLSIMCSCAVGCFTLWSLPGILIACGGALFFLSDSLLLRRLLFLSGKALDWAIMITYYAAQLLFGIACLYL